MFPVASFPCICYRTEDYHCVSVSHLFGSPCLRESLYMSGLISVLPSQKIKLYIDDPTHIETRKACPTDSRMSIGSPLVKMVHFYGHSSKANTNNCSSSRNQMPSSRPESQTHAMTLQMWLQLRHPQWHKLSQRTSRPAYPSRPRTTHPEAPRLLIPNRLMGIRTKPKSL